MVTNSKHDFMQYGVHVLRMGADANSAKRTQQCVRRFQRMLGIR